VRLSPLAAALICSLAPLAPTPALAHGGGSTMPQEVPTAPPGDGATAQGILRELSAKAAKDQDVAQVVAEPIQNVKRALERAHGARAAGDEAHARILDGLALNWAEAGRDLDRAAAAEKVATTTSEKANEVHTRAERARALLEETQARKARAAAELIRAESDAREAARGAADAEARRLEAAKKGGKPAPAARSGAAKKAGGRGGK
jgi:chromosome segregation ATPase